MSHTNIASRTIKEAFADPTAAKQFLADPAEAFRRNGLDIPAGNNQDFNVYFHDVAGNLITKLKSSQDEPQLRAAHAEALASGFGCTACKVSVYAVAVAIVAVGAVGIAELSVESAAVAALARFAGVEAKAALKFIKGLGSAVKDGTTAVAKKVCHWTGAC